MMGNCYDRCKKIRSSNFLHRNITLLMIGLDDAGKTTIAKGLIGDSVKHVLPTVGFSTVVLYHRRYRVTIYDLGGNSQIRDIWSKYFADAHGIIFVVDASKLTRLDEARIIFKNVLSDEKISGKPVLLLGNKQDKEEALDEIDIVDHMRVEQVVNEHYCPARVETCSALHADNVKLDEGICNGYQWLIDTIIKNFGTLNDRVNKDMMDISLLVEKDKEEWRRQRAIREIDDVVETVLHDIPNHNDNPFKPITQILENVKHSSPNNVQHQNGNAVIVRHNNETSNIENAYPHVDTSICRNILQPDSRIMGPISNFKEVQKKKRIRNHVNHRRRKLRNNKVVPISKKQSNVQSFVNDVSDSRKQNLSKSALPEPKQKLIRSTKALQIRPVTAPSCLKSYPAWNLSDPLEVVELHYDNEQIESNISVQNEHVTSDSEDVIFFKKF